MNRNNPFPLIILVLLSVNNKTHAQTNTFPSSGSVGIGTTSPSVKLHIRKTVEGIPSNYTDFLVEQQDANLDLLSGPDDTWGSSLNLVEGDGSGTANVDYWSFARETTNGAGNSSLHIKFGSNSSVYSNSTKILISSSGKVGIGTTTPDEKLTVAGTVKSQEVIVEEDAGADFVFAEDYDLPELEEVKQFVNQNKHLPGIATAEEMKENGVKVGELQMQLLQKIEELTLYVINQQEEIQELKSELKELKNEN